MGTPRRSGAGVFAVERLMNTITNHQHRFPASRIFAASLFVLVLFLPLLAPVDRSRPSWPGTAKRVLETFFDRAVNPLVNIPAAAAETAPAYAAEKAAQSAGTVRLFAGQAATVWVDFRNTGSAAWKNTGAGFIALNVTDPAGKKSAFRHKYWKKFYRPAVLQNSTVQPGETGRIAFAIQAPMTPGTYTERFQLVAENRTWIPGGTLELPIIVQPPYLAEPQPQLLSAVHMQPRQELTLSLSFANKGRVAWKNTGTNFVALNVTDPAGRSSIFRHRNWLKPYRPGKLQEATVRPGEVGTIRVTLQAPSTPGAYGESFQLVAEHLTWIEGSLVRLPIVVDPPPTPIEGEPALTVALRAVTEPMTIKGNGSVAIWRAESMVATEAADIPIVLSYANGVYSVAGGSTSLSGPEPYRVVPVSVDTILEAVNFENRPSWNSSLNDNRFRGSLQIRRGTTTNTVWLLNTVSMEAYLRGLAEVTNTQPPEYLKALLTAARSYATYHALNKTKHAAGGFDLNATTDQVYRGYGFELRAPNVVTAVEATAGRVMTHPAAVSEKNIPGVALGAYSACTNGRTKNFTDVFGGDPTRTPYLVSVDDPNGICTNPRFLQGLDGNHMVGLSAVGARAMAQSGSTYEQILSYYYTGIKLVQQY